MAGALVFAFLFVFSLYIAYAIGKRNGNEKGYIEGHESGYSLGHSEGLRDGSKDTPFHVRRIQANFHGEIMLVRSQAERFLDEARKKVLGQLDACAKVYDPVDEQPAKKTPEWVNDARRDIGLPPVDDTKKGGA